MPWALTEMEPPTEKMSVDCMARTAKRGCSGFWMSCQGAPRFVQHDLVEGAHVEHDAALAERLSAHAVADAGGRHRKLVVARKGPRLCNIVPTVHPDDAVDLGLVEAARIVDGAAELRPLHALERRDRLDLFQIGLALVLAVGGPAILLAIGVGGERLQLAETINAGQYGENSDSGHRRFEFRGKFLHKVIPVEPDHPGAQLISQIGARLVR